MLLLAKILLTINLRTIRASYVDEVFVVSDEQVPQDAGLVEVAEADHVLDALHGGRVHRLDAPLRGQPYLVAVVVHNLELIINAVSFRYSKAFIRPKSVVSAFSKTLLNLSLDQRFLLL